jgi:MoxR-like ATPase
MSTITYAPPLGSDPEFDELAERVRQTLDETGWDTPEAEPINTLSNERGISREEAHREILAEKLTKYGGKTLKGAPAGPPLDAEPTIQVPIEEADLVIPKKATEPYWYEPESDRRLLDHFILTRQALGNAFHGGLAISGPAGQGKTMGVHHAVRRINEEHGLNLRLTVMNCATVTDPQKWFGRREADGGTTRYIKSDLVEAVERGDVILLDDLARIHPNISNGLYSWLDGQQSIHLSDLNVEISVNPNTVFLATWNQGTAYGGQYRLDWAWRERFPFTIERMFPPREDEVRILTSHTGCDADGAAVLVDGAKASRDMWERGDLRTPISTRTLVAAAWLVASGLTEDEAAKYTIIPLFDPDANGIVGAESDRQKVAGIFHMRTGR